MTGPMTLSGRSTLALGFAGLALPLRVPAAHAAVTAVRIGQQKFGTLILLKQKRFLEEALLPSDRESPVVLVGTGLTAVDMLLRLREKGHRGPVTMVSRHGLPSLDHVCRVRGPLCRIRRCLPPAPIWRRFGAPCIAEQVERQRRAGLLAIRRGHVRDLAMSAGIGYLTIVTSGGTESLRIMRHQLHRAGHRLSEGPIPVAEDALPGRTCGRRGLGRDAGDRCQRGA